MGIQALPHTTVRALGATQVLTDPASVVKELIDNALDAHATSIAIEIHSNTIDVIQVRDNGHGIAPEDRALVARRYCTSKILHDDDLKDIGGSSLGFRGEALASAAELSGALTISTRIEGEQVATNLIINQQGEVVSQERASLPVGTTVKIVNFIKTNPVRRQVVLKQTDATLKKIKSLLQAYAFARPTVRLSFRVLKSKNNKGDWVYAPKADGAVEDAALKIVGSACASQCSWTILEHNGFTLQAFLPRPECDASKVSNVGAFVSVDARPVTTARGTFKQILKLFRETLKRAQPSFENVKEPFLYLNISCPSGSYDVNIEPAKDNVIFEDANAVVDAARLLFSEAYPTQAEKPPEIPSLGEVPGLPPGNDTLSEHGLPGHVASGFVPPASALQSERNDVSLLEDPSLPLEMSSDTPQNFRSTMYGYDEEDLDQLDLRPSTSHTESDFEELRRARKDVTVSNPWVLARLNGSVRRPIEPQTISTDRPLRPCDDSSSSPLKQHSFSHRADEASLPTPRPSSPIARTEMHAHPSSAQTSCAPRESRERLPPPQPYTPQVSSDQVDMAADIPQPLRHASPPAYNYDLQPTTSHPPAGTPLEAIPDNSNRPRKQAKRSSPTRINKPFQPPLKDQPQRERVWFDHLEGIERPRAYRRGIQHSDGLVVRGELGDFAEARRSLTPPRRNRDIRDYVGNHAAHATAVEQNLQSASYAMPSENAEMEHHPGEGGPPIDKPLEASGARGFIPASEVAALQAHRAELEKHKTVVPRHRKSSARRALSEVDGNAQARIDSDETEQVRSDEGKRRISRRRSSNKIGRTKSAKLPLERVAAGQGMHNIVTAMSVSTKGIACSIRTIDEGVTMPGYNEPTFPVRSVFEASPPDLHSLTNNIHDLLVEAGSDTEAPGPDSLFQELTAAFHQHGDDDSAMRAEEVDEVEVTPLM